MVQEAELPASSSSSVASPRAVRRRSLQPPNMAAWRFEQPNLVLDTLTGVSLPLLDVPVAIRPSWL